MTIQKVGPTVWFIFALTTACAHQPPDFARAEAGPSQPHFVGLDVFGTDRLSVDEANALVSDLLNPCIANYLAGDFEKYGACKAQIVARIQGRFHFAYLDLSLVRYFHPGDSPVYGTFDVVEEKDAKIRMDFVKRPGKSFSDPSGLIQAWDRYQKTGFDLLAKGEITGSREECPAFHCLFGHRHPALRPFEQIFVDGARENRAALIQIFLYDKDDHRRGSIPFLLAYESDGEELVRILSKRLRDESAFVRNNITRVFADIAAFHPEFSIPVADVARVLDFPETTDRNKASAVLNGIARNPIQLRKYREVLMIQAAPILLRMLRLNQPNNHDYAYTILKAISGRAYGERDYSAWELWYSQEKDRKFK